MAKLKPLDELVQGDYHRPRNFMSALERAPRHLEASGFEPLTESVGDLEGEHTVLASVGEKHG